MKRIFSIKTTDKGPGENIFCWLVRTMLVAGMFFCESNARRLFIGAAVLFSFAVSILKLVFARKEFFRQLSGRAETLLCAAAFFGTVIGKSFGLLDRVPEYDIFLHLLAGVICVALGYYIVSALNKPSSKDEIFFTVFACFTFSCMISGIREILEFLADFELGTNFLHAETLGDDHWFYRLFGKGMTAQIRWGGAQAQQRLYDTDEDMLLSVLSSLVSVQVLYIYLRVKNKELYISRKNKGRKQFTFIDAVCNKIWTEKEKMVCDCNTGDFILWWSVRVLMLYAAFNMVKAEAILLSVNLLGTFAVTFIHLFAPSDSVLGRLSYKVQSLVTVMVFLGSYCGNYIFIYGILPRYDLFLHFISGAISVSAGYYLSKAFFEITDRKKAVLSGIFSLSFAGMVMPVHEIVEFLGDFIWGTDNQGFSWAPTADSFFFRVFGNGAGNTELYYLFDTMYDMLLAWSMAIIAFVALVIYLLRRIGALNLKKENEGYKKLRQ